MPRTKPKKKTMADLEREVRQLRDRLALARARLIAAVAMTDFLEVDEEEEQAVVSCSRCRGRNSHSFGCRATL